MKICIWTAKSQTTNLWNDPRAPRWRYMTARRHKCASRVLDSTYSSNRLAKGAAKVNMMLGSQDEQIQVNPHTCSMWERSADVRKRGDSRGFILVGEEKRWHLGPRVRVSFPPFKLLTAAKEGYVVFRHWVFMPARINNRVVDNKSC